METLPTRHHKHIIFLSHSGHQKGFAIDLSKRLSHSYAVFFDQEHHSLSPGQPFPPLIFSATNTCKLAIVVLSHEFFSSRWPMLELCAFADRLSSSSSQSDAFTLLPLFFKLSPGDLKNEANLEQWRKAWKGFEQKDGRIRTAKCEEAVTKLLPRLSGIVRHPESKQGEASYLDEVVDAISAILRPPRGFSDPFKKYVARDRLCKIILDKFQELEETRTCSSSMDACILGMYGIPGTGKSTLCQYLCDSMFHEFRGNVIYMELRTDADSHADKPSLILDQCSKLLSKFNPYVKDVPSSVMDLNMVLHRINDTISIRKAFVVLDNISTSNYESYTMILRPLLNSAILGPGSKIMLVAQSATILDDLHSAIGCQGGSSKHRYDIMEVPWLTEEEATKVIMNQCPSMKQEVATDLLDKMRFPKSSSMCIPFVLEQIGVLFRKRHCDHVKELELLLKMVDANKNKLVHDLLDMNFKRLPEDLQRLFFNIALFIIPAGYSELKDATPILSQMHGINDTFTLRWKIMDLEKHCALSVVYDKLRVHDIFTEYALSIPGNSASYVSQLSLDIDAATKQQNHVIHLKCLEARTIIIGMCTESPHHHWLLPYHDQEVCLRVELGAVTQALFVKNRCRHSKSTLALSGDVSSLVCLRTENVLHAVLWPCGNAPNLSNVVRLELVHKADIARHIQMKPTGSSIFGGAQLIRRILTPLMFMYYQSPQKLQPLSSFISSGRMRGLRVLMLNNVAGAQSLLQNVCQFCPELEILEVHNEKKERMDVMIDKAPKLKRFILGGHSAHDDPFPSVRGILHVRECPDLQEISVDGSFDEVNVDGLHPTNLVRFEFADDRSSGFLPWKLVSSSACELSQLQKLRLSCRKIERLHFTREHLRGCLPFLEELRLARCNGLQYVSMDPDCVPNLVEFVVWFCDELEALDGVEDMRMKDLRLWELPQLQLECDFMRWLGTFSIWNCPNVRIGLTSVNGSNVNTHIQETVNGSNVNTHIQETDDSTSWVGLDRWTFSECPFTRLEIVTICRLHDLRDIDGIQHLTNVAYLFVGDMSSLTRVSGSWPATIASVIFDECPMLIEVPAFEQTPRLWDLQFRKCVRLEAVHSCFGQMERLTRLDLMDCEGMEAFPMDGHPSVMNKWKKREREYGTDIWSPFYSVKVQGSGFANVEVMKGWLRDAELGSLLFEAAVEALIWEHALKGTTGALDALQDYCFALMAEARVEELLLFRHLFSHILDFFVPVILPRAMPVFGVREMPLKVEQFLESILKQFPQLGIQHCIH